MSDRHGLLRALREPRSANKLLLARVTVLVMLTVILVRAGAFVFYRLERNAPGSEVTTYGDALFWTSSQITTISSSLANPISTGGAHPRRTNRSRLDCRGVAAVRNDRPTHPHREPQARAVVPPNGRRG
jgi:hypothetical protein